MGRLVVPYVAADQNTAIEDISYMLDAMERHPIQAVPWPTFAYKPDATFAIAHHNDCIFLKYFIKEKSIRALHRKTNDPVFQDSCVEFFISFDNDQEYYNLEFNCIGTCLLGFGRGKTARALVGEEQIQKIRRHALIKSWNEDGSTLNSWELTMTIPLEVFAFHSIASLTGRSCKVNFFKCGDELPEPHFLAWKNIESSSPNFHLPEYFGTMMFICQ
jgi:hypothetical protein